MPSSDPRPELAAAARFLSEHLGSRIAAHVAGFDDVEQIQRIVSGGQSDDDVTDARIRGAYEITRRLVGSYDEATARAWLFGANTDLDDRAPIDVLRGALDAESVASVLAAAVAFAPSRSAAPEQAPIAGAARDEVVHLIEVGPLTTSDVARVTGTAEETVQAWLARRASPSGPQAERLGELSGIVRRLARVVEPAYVARWLRTPIPVLDGHAPLEAIAAGECRRVGALVSGLESPGAT